MNTKKINADYIEELIIKDSTIKNLDFLKDFDNLRYLKFKINKILKDLYGLVKVSKTIEAMDIDITNLQKPEELCDVFKFPLIFGVDCLFYKDWKKLHTLNLYGKKVDKKILKKLKEILKNTEIINNI